MASVAPHSFLILIFISPVVLRWHLVSSRRLYEEDFSILMCVSSSSSSPSLYHWIFMGSRPTKDSLNAASFPVLIITGFMNSVRSSGLILGGSSRKKTHFQIETFIADLKYTILLIFPVPFVLLKLEYLKLILITVPSTFSTASVLRPSASHRYFPASSSLQFLIISLR